MKQLLLTLLLLISSSSFAGVEIISPKQNSEYLVTPLTIFLSKTSGEQVTGFWSDIDEDLSYYKVNQCSDCPVEQYEIYASSKGLASGQHNIRVNYFDPASNSEGSAQLTVKIVNAYPKMRIISPIEGQTYAMSEGVDLFAIAKDGEVNLQYELQWSNEEGTLWTGNQQLVPFNAGKHSVTLSMLGLRGVLIEETISFIIKDENINKESYIRIISHVNGEVINPHTLYDNDAKLLKTVVFDADMTQFTVSYLSSLDGPVYSSGNNLRLDTLSPGTHDITATFRNAALKLVSDTITLTIINDAPIVAITSPQEGEVFPEGATIALEAYMYDDNQDFNSMNSLDESAYWASKQGLIFNGVYLKQSLPVGVHELMFSVHDVYGNYATDTVTITVGDPVKPQISVSITNPMESIIPFSYDALDLTAEAFDESGIDISSRIFWSSNRENPITEIEYFYPEPGRHTIAASIYDSATETITGDIKTITITNKKPKLKVVAWPNTLSTDPLEDFVSFDLMPIIEDEEEGDNLSFSGMNWFSVGDNNEVFSPSYKMYSEPDREQVIVAKVNDSFGKSTFVKIQTSPNNPLAQKQCASKGKNQNHEWIESVVFHPVMPYPPLDPFGYEIAPVEYKTGKNSGYLEISPTQITLFTGSNNILLTPGFKDTNYAESWRIWIDFNNNGKFEDSEVLADKKSKTETKLRIEIAKEVLAGYYRMRISMRYNQKAPGCGEYTYGETEDYIVAVVSVSEDESLESSYCAAKVQNTEYEFIESVGVGENTIISGDNNGWADFSAEPVFMLQYGNNKLSLKPGFSGKAFLEHWTVHIDYNQDKLFSSEEWVYSGDSSTEIINNISVPATALPGETRMRVLMSYEPIHRPCGNLKWGEVEDFSVTIQ